MSAVTAGLPNSKGFFGVQTGLTERCNSQMGSMSFCTSATPTGFLELRHVWFTHLNWKYAKYLDLNLSGADNTHTHTRHGHGTASSHMKMVGKQQKPEWKECTSNSSEKRRSKEKKGSVPSASCSSVLYVSPADFCVCVLFC